MKSAAAFVLVALAALGAAPGARAERPAPVDVFALPEFRQATANLPPESRLEAAAILHIKLRQWEQAIPLLEVLVKQQDDNLRSELWILLAIAYNAVGEWQEAYDAAKIAITLDPLGTYHVERGIAAFQLGRDREAAADLTRYLETITTSARAHLYLGLARARLGELRAAEASLRRATELNPRLALMADYYRGLIAAQTGRFTEARILLQETLDAFEGVDVPFRQVVGLQLEKVRGLELAAAAPAMRRAAGAVVRLDAEHSLKHLPRPSP